MCEMCVYDYLMMIFTAMSGIGACVAVIVAVVIYKRQKTIALFDRRTQILNDFEHYIFDELRNWDWDGNTRAISKYTRSEVVALFDESYGQLQDDILKTANECSILFGDIKHAERHGECHGKTADEIEDEKIRKENALGERFKEKRDKANHKWLKI